MMREKIDLRLWYRLIWLILIAILIFVYSGSYERYTKIEDFTEQVPIESGQGYYYDITQKYPQIGLEGFESTLSKLFQRLKYNEVCFRDEGSKITERAFEGSNLIVSISYYNETRDVSHKTGSEEVGFSEQQCFEIVDKKRITWNWEFGSNATITKGFLEVKEFHQIILNPKVSTYLRVSNFYYLFAGLLSLFYSGIFLWALTRIYKFLKSGFE